MEIIKSSKFTKPFGVLRPGSLTKSVVVLSLGLFIASVFLYAAFTGRKGFENQDLFVVIDFNNNRSSTLESEMVADVNKRPRILCWILTGPANHHTKAIHVKNTWGRHCDKLLFMSSQADEILGSIALPNVEEGHAKLWQKTKEAFKYIWKNHRQDADWFYKADDDTYAFVEHLRSFLADYNTSEPYFLGGSTSYPDVKEVVNLGGPGYVLSEEALRRLIQEALPDVNKCKFGYKGDEDTLMSVCLASVGIFPSKTWDREGRLRFVNTRAEDIFKRCLNKQHESNSSQLGLNILDCAAHSVISFHYVPPESMYVYEFLSQQLQQHQREGPTSSTEDVSFPEAHQ